MKKIRMSLGVQISILSLSSSIIVGAILFIFMMVGMKRIEAYSIEQLSKNMMEGYDNSISGQVDTAISILEYFDKEVAAGEMSVYTAQSMSADLIRNLRYGADSDGCQKCRYWWCRQIFIP